MELQQAGIILSAVLQGETDDYVINVEYEVNEVIQTVFITYSNENQNLCISIQQRDDHIDISVRQFHGFDDQIANQWFLNKLQKLTFNQLNIQTSTQKLIKIIISFCFLRFNQFTTTPKVHIQIAQEVFLQHIEQKLKNINLQQLKQDIEYVLSNSQEITLQDDFIYCEESCAESILTDIGNLGTSRYFNVCQAEQEVPHIQTLNLQLSDIIQAYNYLINHFDASQFQPGLKEKHFNSIKKLIHQLYKSLNGKNVQQKVEQYDDTFFPQEIKIILKFNTNQMHSSQQNYFQTQFMDIQLLFENQLKKTFKCKKILEKVTYYVLMIEVSSGLKNTVIEWYQRLQMNKEIKISKIRYIWNEIKLGNVGPEVRQIYIQEEFFSELTLGQYINHGFNLKITSQDLIEVTRQLLVALLSLHQEGLYHGDITENSVLIKNQEIVFRGLRYHENIPIKQIHYKDLQQLAAIIKKLWENTIYLEENYQIKQLIQDMNQEITIQELLNKYKHILQYYDYKVIQNNADNLLKVIITTQPQTQQIPTSFQQKDITQHETDQNISEILHQAVEHLKKNQDFMFQPFSANLITLDKNTYPIFKQYVNYLESHLLIGYNQVLQLRVNNIKLFNYLLDQNYQYPAFYIINNEIIFVGKMDSFILCCKTIKRILKIVQYDINSCQATVLCQETFQENQQPVIQQINDVFKIVSQDVIENVKMTKMFKYQIKIQCQATIIISVDQYEQYYQVILNLFQ